MRFELLQSEVPHTSSARAVLRLNFFDILALAIPLFRFVEIDVVGRLYLTELILALLFLPLMLSQGTRLLGRTPLAISVALLTWLIAQVITDVIRATAFDDFARGWAKISFTLLNFCVLYLLLHGRPRRLVIFATGSALGGLAEYFVAPDAYALLAPWKFGYGSGITLMMVILAVLISSQSQRRVWPAAVLFVAAVANLYMDFRSMGGVAFLAGCYILFVSPRKQHASRLRLKHIASVVIVAVFAAWAVVQTYQYAARSGWLGSDAQEKLAMQTVGDYGLLLGGRSEIMVSRQAVADAPIIGHGSWAKDCRYASLYVDLKRNAGYGERRESESCLIPSHSYLMGAWVESGLLGAITWLWLFTYPVRAAVRLRFASTPLAPLVIFSAIALIWDIFFSPFAAWARVMVPFTLVLITTYLSRPERFQPVQPIKHGGKF